MCAKGSSNPQASTFRRAQQRSPSQNSRAKTHLRPRPAFRTFAGDLPTPLHLPALVSISAGGSILAAHFLTFHSRDQNFPPNSDTTEDKTSWIYPNAPKSALPLTTPSSAG